MKQQGFMNNKTVMLLKVILAAALAVAAVVLLAAALVRIGKASKKEASLYMFATFVRTPDAEEFDEDANYQTAVFAFNSEKTDGNVYLLEKKYSTADYEALPERAAVEGYVYTDGTNRIVFDHAPSQKEVKKEQRSFYLTKEEETFGKAMACLLTAVALCVMYFFGKHFTDYEQIWFITIMAAAAVVSVIAPEESANGVNGLIIMALYLADTFLNILCELLISKQSKWNFIVSVFVELTEIAICLVLMYRFATLASTLFFWLPCDIISFINWHRHPDRQEEELTQVRTLKGWQEALIITGIVLWTVGIGYFLTTLDFGSDFFKNRTVEVIVCYMDACATAVGIANGLFILFRFREQWIAWYIEAALETAMNILAGQFVLLVLKVGYFTNTTYGYIKWTKYIKSREAETLPEKEKTEKLAR